MYDEHFLLVGLTCMFLDFACSQAPDVCMDIASW